MRFKTTTKTTTATDKLSAAERIALYNTAAVERTTDERMAAHHADRTGVSLADRIGTPTVAPYTLNRAARAGSKNMNRRQNHRDRFDARTERAQPTHMTALAHGMMLTASRGDTAARELTPEWHAWHKSMIALRERTEASTEVFNDEFADDDGDRAFDLAGDR